MPFAIQPSIEYLNKVNRSPVADILDAAQVGYGAYTQVQEGKVKREKDKVDYYTALRKAGYTPNDATQKVEGLYGAFKGPTGDPEDSEVTANARAKTKRARNNAIQYIKLQAEQGADRQSVVESLLSEYPDVDITDTHVRSALDASFTEEPLDPIQSRKGKGKSFTNRLKEQLPRAPEIALDQATSGPMGTLAQILGQALKPAAQRAKKKAGKPKITKEEALAELRRRRGI